MPRPVLCLCRLTAGGFDQSLTSRTHNIGIIIYRSRSVTVWLCVLSTFCMVVDFEAQIRDLQQKRKNVGVNDGPAPAENRVGLGQEGHYDSDIYEGTGGIGRFEGYLDSIPATDDQEVSYNAECDWCMRIVYALTCHLALMLDCWSGKGYIVFNRAGITGWVPDIW